MEQRPSNQEIDLLKLLAKTYSIIKRNIVLVIVCPGVGLLLGLLYSQWTNWSTSPSNASSKINFLISSDLMTENEATFLSNYLILSDSLPGLDKNQNFSIHSFEVRKEQFDDRTIVYIKLSTTIQNDEVLGPATKSLQRYFIESEPVAKQRSIKERFYKTMIEKIDSDIAWLEKMKSDQNPKTSIILDPYTQNEILYERKIEFQNALESNGVSIVANKEAHRKLKLMYALFIGFFSGVVMFVIILFLKFFSAYYKQFEKENN